MTGRYRICAGPLALLTLALAACGGPADQQAGAPEPAETPRPATDTAARAAPSPSTPAATDEPRSCAVEIGRQAADRRAQLCHTLSPATHPPCNVANSCAMIDDEIARSCALLSRAGSPPADCRPAPRSSEAAVDVVKRYYAALDARDYATAWLQWGQDGPPNQPLEKFRQGFAHTRSTHVTIDSAGEAEGAAGSLYLTVPVRVEATLDSGELQRFRGHYIVRRVNDVDGATADQLRWHIDSAHLQLLPPR
ncbi:hypothetical protein [Sphingopyxis granuli]|uniref:Lipoprotein n=1 Tax=Sphingopyxis granuli TaxID=267128 RepID=A0AA86L361_9SPHN|nr:hypothetical protein [Sphingopyxis granuli]AMG74153.1 Uncharacterized protein SGRAN_1775 [Sphingopyxis granuli]